MAIRILWRYVIGKTKTVFKNYNVVERAEKIMETEKRAAPRHPGTEAKFKVLIKGIPELNTEVEKKPAELLDRLKIVKVTSEGSPEEKIKKSLPQRREATEIPTYGFEDPKVIPAGKCSLKQVLEFIVSHQNDPKAHSVESIAKTYKMMPNDVKNVIEHFHVFQLHISREGKGVAKSTLESSGVSKVVQPVLRSKFAHLETQDVPTAPEGTEERSPK